MPHLTIDNREIDVPAGTRLVQAARQLDIEIPTLCWREGCRPNTTCMVCLVRVRDGGTEGHRDIGRLVPACATVAQDGMCVESETDEVRQVRQAALDLLLSDHAGECRAPCQYACPFDSDVSRMLECVAAGRLDEAIATLRQSIPLAASLARVAPDGCERACRRCAVDESFVDRAGQTLRRGEGPGVPRAAVVEARAGRCDAVRAAVRIVPAASRSRS